MMAYMYVVGSTTGCRLVTRFPVNSAPNQLVPSQLGPKFKCKALIIVYSNFNATKQDIELETGETGDWNLGTGSGETPPPR